MGKKVIYIFLPPDFPTDPCEPEPEEKVQLQAAYRQRLRESGVLRHSAANPLELENRILRIRDELAILREEMRRSSRRLRLALVAILILLLGIAAGVWGLRQAGKHQSTVIESVRKTEVENSQSLNRQEQSSTRIEAQLEQIRSLSANARADRLGTALAAANVEELSLLRKAGVTPREVQTTLARKQEGSDQSIAQSFFASSRNLPVAVDWLKAVLKDGLDPNMTVPDLYFEQRAILAHALKAGNADATIALLEAGASPHPYQGIWLTSYPITAFLFPYSYLMQNETFDAEEKRRVAKALRKAGAAITRFEPGVVDTKANKFTSSISEQREEVEKVFTASKSVFGFNLEETPPLSQTVESPIARAAGKEGGPWQQFLQEMPLRLISEKEPDFGPYWIEVRNFIGTYFNRGYFLGVAFDYERGPEYALIEVSKDFRTWNTYLFLGTRAGMLSAKDEKDPMSAHYHMDCWKRFEMEYFPDKGEMMLVKYYKYRATHAACRTRSFAETPAGICLWEIFHPWQD